MPLPLAWCRTESSDFQWSPSGFPQIFLELLSVMNSLFSQSRRKLCMVLGMLPRLDFLGDLGSSAFYSTIAIKVSDRQAGGRNSFIC